MAETVLTPMSVYTAWPTIRIAGQEEPRVTELMLELAMTEREGGLSALELTLSNVASDPSGGADLAFEDGAILKLGAQIAVYGGDQDAPREIFQGTITGLEATFPENAPPTLTVLAEDACQQARMTRRTRVFTTTSIAELARGIAADLGLTPVITGFSEGIGVQVQLDETDLAFLRRVLARFDGDLQVVGKELHVSPRGDVRRGTLELRLHGQLRQARVIADLAHQVTEVTATGWDAANGRRVSARATGANTGPGQGGTGAAALRDARGGRSDHLAHLAVASDDEAQAVADAAFDLRARRFVSLHGVAEGNPALRVGTHLTLSGLGPRFDNTYYVVEARHHFDLTRGYETVFEAECAFWGGSR